MEELALYSAFYGTPIYCIIIGISLGKMFEKAPKNEDFTLSVISFTAALTLMMTSIAWTLIMSL